MQYRKFGQTDIQVSAIGFGCMVINHGYGIPNEKEGLATLEAALEKGINFWDTADMYANGQNEAVISRYLPSVRNKVFLATKFGFRPGADGKSMELDCSPAYIKTAVENSLRRLKTEVIDLYYAHRVDPKVPIEDTVGAMSRLVEEGKVRFLGLSEAAPATIRRAHAVHPISALQSEYSLLTREPEKEVIPFCAEMGITFVPFSPLARGLVTNTLQMQEVPENDFRHTLPRYTSTYAENNQNLASALAAFAEGKGYTAAQISLAWILAQGQHIIPIPGTKKVHYLNQNAGAADIELSQDDLREIQAILDRWPHTGPRYNEAAQKMVDKG